MNDGQLLCSRDRSRRCQPHKTASRKISWTTPHTQTFKPSSDREGLGLGGDPSDPAKVISR